MSSSEVAKKAKKKVLHDSSFVKEEKFLELPAFSIGELSLGKFLGEGGFYSVFSVKGINVFEKQAFQTVEDRDYDVCQQTHMARQKRLRNHLASICHQGSKGSIEHRYAIKFIRPDLGRGRKKYLTAVKDIVTEAYILSSLSHQHIVKIRGVVNCSLSEWRQATNLDSDFSSTCEDSDSAQSTSYGQDAGQMIIMDRLYGTLDEKFVEWIAESKCSTGQFTQEKKRTNYHKIKLALQVSEALNFLHEKNIMYRDIKPENIGFDRRGNAKMFDFGLAKELDECKRDKNGLYQLSLAGTKRYMSPEVMRGDRYNFSSDVYSFGVLLWEIFNLKKAFQNMSWDDLLTRKETGTFIKISKSTPERIRYIVEDSCEVDWTLRPTFDVVASNLKKELQVTHFEPGTNSLSHFQNAFRCFYANFVI